MKKAWSLPNQHIKISGKFRYEGCQAAIGAISDKRGLIHIELHPKSIKTATFLVFLQNLWKKVK